MIPGHGSATTKIVQHRKDQGKRVFYCAVHDCTAGEIGACREALSLCPVYIFPNHLTTTPESALFQSRSSSDDCLDYLNAWWRARERGAAEG